MTKKEFNRLYAKMDAGIKALVHSANIINLDEFVREYAAVHKEIYHEDFLTKAAAVATAGVGDKQVKP